MLTSQGVGSKKSFSISHKIDRNNWLTIETLLNQSNLSIPIAYPYNVKSMNRGKNVKTFYSKVKNDVKS